MSIFDDFAENNETGQHLSQNLQKTTELVNFCTKTSRTQLMEHWWGSFDLNIS